MKRIAYTIILNGEKHLLHNNYAEYLLNDCLDYWVIVEGAVERNSYKWCPGDNSQFHINGHSIDATNNILDELVKKYPDKIQIVRKDGLWSSKNEMTNKAIEELKKKYNEGLLWQIDIDEQWSLEDLIINEAYLNENYADVGICQLYQFIGNDIIAYGSYWGGNSIARLWNWHGELFDTHAPPKLKFENKSTEEIKEILLPKKFYHYSYYYEMDVIFKAEWYGYGEDFINRWFLLQKQTDFPRPLHDLFPGWEGNGGIIYKKNNF